ncbi:S-adenosyl-L-methionine-dependent methyltransferase [Pseudovirgaria hyperparasitica]|uniref:S-adenosyl-L-methionine-dependent methyltransferase n=1 Tax=Pseudovirgaria hyperparasitica TaxID=470096 RepID=A0A6A6W6M2_9PEZI|nr:S-adenosyl-L-methionine-dependent methyltransferase [Pseudovirgaria hyperparasitica]KAF2757217.1 S-adenosyl-L-methionine-dependent methyltransferase [Pseudovirgaria hyperparasitica]
MSDSLIVQLARQITQNVEAIDQYHDAAGLRKHSFDIDTPPKYNYPPHIETARQEVFAATTDLRDLVLGPVEALKIRSESYADLVSLHVIYKFGIAESFPVGGEASFKDIAAVSGITEHNTSRLMRHGMLQHMFKEVRPGIVAHTASTQAIAEDESVKDMLGTNVDELWRSSPRVTDALQGWPTSKELSQTPYSIGTGTGAPFFAEMAKHPQRAQRFANALRQYNPDHLTLRRTLVEAYDWAALGAATIVDLGAISGGLSIRLAELYPNLRFVVTNSSAMLAQQYQQQQQQQHQHGPSSPEHENNHNHETSPRPNGTTSTSTSPSTPNGTTSPPPQAVTDRITWIPAPIFDTQPLLAHGADIYYLRFHLHSCPDAYAVRLLHGLIPCLKPGARLLLHDFVPTRWAGISAWEERQMRIIDMQQLIFLNSQTRSLAQWEALFAQADARFEFLGVTASRHGLDIFEVRWRG